MFGKYSPGPAVYDCKSSVGKQLYSQKESAPFTKFGTQVRMKNDYELRASELPGAGQYEPSVSIGKQSLSKTQSMPIYGFGTCSRDRAGKVFISAEHEKSHFGEEGPGPFSADPTSALGKQVKSKLRSNPKWGFGTETRFKMNFNRGKDAPGWGPAPGDYSA